MQVLIAEDSLEYVTLLVAAIDTKARAVLAHDGDEAWQKFKSHSFDLIITDWHMPRADGLWLIRSIKTLGCAHPPILLCTSDPGSVPDWVRDEAGVEILDKCDFGKVRDRIMFFLGRKTVKKIVISSDDVSETVSGGLAYIVDKEPDATWTTLNLDGSDGRFRGPRLGVVLGQHQARQEVKDQFTHHVVVRGGAHDGAEGYYRAEPVRRAKTLSNTCIAEAKAKVSDIEVFGNGDAWQLICKVSSESQGWMKSTKAMSIPRTGSLVQVTTQQRNPDGSYAIAEALTFVPGVRVLVEDGASPKLFPR